MGFSEINHPTIGVSQKGYGKPPFLIGKPCINGPFSIANC